MNSDIPMEIVTISEKNDTENYEEVKSKFDQFQWHFGYHLILWSITFLQRESCGV